MCLYLTKRQGMYYFRRAIPDDLRPAFNGAGEFMFSLRTKDKDEAKRKRDLEALRTTQELDDARARLTTAQPSAAAQRVSAWSPSEFEMEQMELREQEDREKQQRRDDEADFIAFLDERLKGSTKKMPRRLRALKYMQERDSFDRALVVDQLAIARARIAELEKGQLPAPAQTPTDAPQDATTDAAGESSGTKLDPTIVDLWAAERQVQPQGVSMYRAAVRWFHERVGEKAVDQITKQDVLAFKGKLVAEGCTPANIKNKLSRLRTVLQYATDEGYIATNPADGVTIRDTKGTKNRRLPFDLASLKALFGSPIYTARELPSDTRAGGEAAYPFHLFSDQQMAALLQSLAAKSSLTYDEIAGALCRKNRRSSLLEVQHMQGSNFALACGPSLEWTARALPEGDSRLDDPIVPRQDHE